MNALASGTVGALLANVRRWSCLPSTESIQPWRPRSSTGEAGTADQDRTLEWTETALALIEAAPDPLPMLGIFGRRMRPGAWSDSLAGNPRPQLPLLHALRMYFDWRVSGLGNH